MDTTRMLVGNMYESHSPFTRSSHACVFVLRLSWGSYFPTHCTQCAPRPTIRPRQPGHRLYGLGTGKHRGTKEMELENGPPAPRATSCTATVIRQEQLAFHCSLGEQGIALHLFESCCLLLMHTHILQPESESDHPIRDSARGRTNPDDNGSMSPADCPTFLLAFNANHSNFVRTSDGAGGHSEFA